jgi:hypothetical protein
MPESKNVQWPFVPADAPPLFFNPEPNSRKAPVYTEPWIYADHRTRKRRHSEVNSSIDEPPQPTLPQNHTTYASYLTEQSHLARKVRVTPYLLLNQNLQRFRVSDIGDHIVDWAVERLKPAAKCLALPWHCLIDVRHERLARKDRGERRCWHINEQERLELRSFRNVDMFIERVERSMGTYQRRMPRNDDESESEEESEFGDGDVEMKDAPPLAPPRPNLNPTVEDVEEGEIDDDEVEFMRENSPSPPPRRWNHTAPIGNTEFADLDDDEIDVLRELRQRYNTNAEDLQDASSLILRLPRFAQQVDDVENEARPTTAQNGRGDNEDRKSPPPVREDAGNAGNESSSSSSEDGNDNEGGPAPPVGNGIDERHDERNKPSSSNTNHGNEHAANSINVDLRPVEPRPAPILLPAHLIPAQIPRTTPVRNRHREEPSTASVQGTTYAEYDRFQEMALARLSPPITRRSTRIAGSRSSVTRSSSTRTPATRTPETEPLVTTSSLFTPFVTSNDGAPKSFDKRTKHESTQTSSIWGTIIEKVKVFAPKPEQPKRSPKPPATKLGGEKKAAERPSQDNPFHVSSSSAAKSAIASTPGNKTIIPGIKVTASPTPLSNPAAGHAQPNTLSSNVFSQSNATVGSDPAMRKGLGESIIEKKKNAATNSSKPGQNNKASMAPAAKSGLGNSLLGRKKTNTDTNSPQSDQKLEASPAPKPQPNFGNNMLERKKRTTDANHSRPDQPTEAPLATASRPGLGNNMLEKKRNLASQPTPPTQLPSFGRQSVRQHTYVDDDVHAQNAGSKPPLCTDM